ncbi:intracellular septation protein [Comamonas sp. BIGb0152]|uniref:septation protein A n=1 Tax=Comamonas sp. BIGb0152 TaxID=2940601 RepID=UPI00216911D2|nr:septation protein A [Comamonas sp. BIGb0152]MCS4293059.1 intracellular septation protein [Comamonas sp. BIGb0152]
MKFLIDFFPILLFFAAFKVWGVFVATGVAIAATIAQIAYLRFKVGKVEPMQWISLGVIVVFGGATLLFHDESFIKWKPTVLYWVMAVVLLGGQWLFNKNLMQKLMSSQVQLPQAVWNTVNYSWALFFTIMGIVNIWVAYKYDLDTWVTFKMFGGLGLMLVFVIGQAMYLSRHIQQSPEDQP